MEKLGVGRRDPQHLEVGEGAPESGSGRGWAILFQRLVATVKVYFLANALYDPQAFSKVCYTAQPGVGCPLGNKGPGSPIGGEAGQGRGGPVTTIQPVVPL